MPPSSKPNVRVCDVWQRKTHDNDAPSETGMLRDVIEFRFHRIRRPRCRGRIADFDAKKRRKTGKIVRKNIRFQRVKRIAGSMCCIVDAITACAISPGRETDIFFPREKKKKTRRVRIWKIKWFSYPSANHFLPTFPLSVPHAAVETSAQYPPGRRSRDAIYRNNAAN